MWPFGIGPKGPKMRSPEPFGLAVARTPNKVTPKFSFGLFAISSHPLTCQFCVTLLSYANGRLYPRRLALAADSNG
jgi:hypothetical protein